MNLILWHASHTGIPLADQVHVLVHSVRLDVVEDDRVDVLASGEDLAEAALELAVELAAFLGAVDQGRQRAGLLALRGVFPRSSFFCKRRGE